MESDYRMVDVGWIAGARKIYREAFHYIDDRNFEIGGERLLRAMLSAVVATGEVSSMDEGRAVVRLWLREAKVI
jgi:hypothetical protein